MPNRLECQTNTSIPMAGPTADPADPIDIALAKVLRVFAERGRAIREERAKREAAQIISQSEPQVSDKAPEEGT